MIPNLIALLASLIALNPAWGESKCPPQKALDEAVRAKEESLPTILSQLKKLNAKEIDPGTSISGLFTVALDDDAAVATRVQELQTSVDTPGIAIEPYKSWLLCTQNERILQRIRHLSTTAHHIDAQRILFLSLPREARLALANASESSARRTQDLESLTAIGERAKTNQAEAQAVLAAAESSAATEKSAGGKDLAGYQALVARYLVDLEASQIGFIEYQKQQTQKYTDYRSEIGTLLAKGSTEHGESLAPVYDRSAQIWRDLVDHIFDLYLRNDFQLVAKPPGAPDSADSVLIEESKKKYVEVYQNALQRSEEANTNRSLFLRREKEMIADLLLTAGSARSTLFNRCRKEDCKPLFEISEQTLADVLREVKVVPFKLFSFGISKSIEFRNKVSSGIRGWIDISKQLGFLLLLLLTPFVVYSFFKRLAGALGRLRRTMISRSMIGHARRTKLAIWLGRLMPFFPWIAMWLTAFLVGALVGRTDLRELADTIGYFQLYFLYRIFREMLAEVIQSSFVRGSLELHRQIHRKVLASATRLSRIGLIEAFVLKATADAVREVYVYTIFSNIILWLNVIVICLEAARWEEQIWLSSKQSINDKTYAWLSKFREKWIRFLFNPLLFAWVVVHAVASAMISRLANLDVFKWIASEIFRKRLERKGESIRATAAPLPKDYLARFSIRETAASEIYVTSSQRQKEVIANAVTQWASGDSTEDAILLRGNRGMGKSTALSHALGALDASAIEASLHALKTKYCTRQDFFGLLSEILGKKISNSEEVLAYDAERERKRAVFIDDFQNLFLSEIGGFEAYNAFLEVASLPTRNLFWCVAINTRSWEYLTGAFGSDHFYGRVIDFQPWRDTEIQELILKRHRLTGYSLEFDDLIKALGEDSSVRMSETELQFFRLLWGQSRGNPRSALVYWLSSLSWMGDKSLRVGVPTFLSSTAVSTMNDDSLFVLAAVTKHENLTPEEVHRVTGIPAATVRKCLKMAEDLEIIWADATRRYRVTPKGQYVLDYFLLGKNFLHE